MATLTVNTAQGPKKVTVDDGLSEAQLHEVADTVAQQFAGKAPATAAQDNFESRLQYEAQYGTEAAAGKMVANAGPAAIREAGLQTWAGIKQLGANIADAWGELFHGEKPHEPDVRGLNNELIQRGAPTMRRGAAVTAQELLRQATDTARDEEAGVDITARDVLATGATLGVSSIAPEFILPRATTIAGAAMKNSAAGAGIGALTFSPDNSKTTNTAIGAAGGPVFGVLQSLAPATMNSIGRGLVAAANSPRIKAAVDAARSVLPNVKPTLAQITGIPALAALERQVYNTKMVNIYATQDEELLKGFTGIIDAKVPQGVTLDDAFTSLQSRAANQLGKMQKNANEMWNNGMAQAADLERGIVNHGGLTEPPGPATFNNQAVSRGGVEIPEAPKMRQRADIPVDNLRAQWNRVYQEANDKAIGPSGVDMGQMKALNRIIIGQQTLSAADLDRLLRGLSSMKTIGGRASAYGHQLGEALDADLETLAQRGSGKQNEVVQTILDTRKEYARQQAEIRALSNSTAFKLLGVPDNVDKVTSENLLKQFKTFLPEKQAQVRQFLEANAPDLLATMRQEVISTAARRAGTLRAANDARVDAERLATDLFDSNEGYSLRTSGLWNAEDKKKLDAVGDAVRMLMVNRPTTRSAGAFADPVNVTMTLASQSAPFAMRQFARAIMGTEGYKVFTDPELQRILMVHNRSTTGSTSNLLARAALMQYFRTHGGTPPPPNDNQR